MILDKSLFLQTDYQEMKNSMQIADFVAWFGNRWGYNLTSGRIHQGVPSVGGLALLVNHSVIIANTKVLGPKFINNYGLIVLCFIMQNIVHVANAAF